MVSRSGERLDYPWLSEGDAASAESPSGRHDVKSDRHAEFECLAGHVRRRRRKRLRPLHRRYRFLVQRGVTGRPHDPACHHLALAIDREHDLGDAGLPVRPEFQRPTRARDQTRSRAGAPARQARQQRQTCGSTGTSSSATRLASKCYIITPHRRVRCQCVRGGRSRARSTTSRRFAVTPLLIERNNPVRVRQQVDAVHSAPAFPREKHITRASPPGRHEAGPSAHPQGRPAD